MEWIDPARRSKVNKHSAVVNVLLQKVNTQLPRSGLGGCGVKMYAHNMFGHHLDLHRSKLKSLEKRARTSKEIRDIMVSAY